MLKEGDKAPSFNLDSDGGGKVSLRDFGGKTLVLYFYPRDSTPGCTRQAQAFTASKAAIERAGGAVVGVSRDSLKSHASFREKCGLGITLLSDPDLAVHKAYGAWGEKTMYGKKVEGVLRSTFLVRDGRIVRVFPSVKVDGHADAVLGALTGAPAGKAPAAKATKAKATKAEATKAKKTPAPGKAAKAPAAKAKARKAPAPGKAAKAPAAKRRAPKKGASR
ncbi:MAG: peroxiredoxin [Labilithrix sp.]|nr:peroxiredoxin [Labilithrix sp.]